MHLRLTQSYPYQGAKPVVAMFDNHLRNTKETLFVHLAKGLNGHHIHPIFLTCVALGFGILSALALAQQHTRLGFLFWFLNRFFDGLDGTVARVGDLQSDLGGYLDILFDFITYAIIPIALVIANASAAAYLSLAFLLATFYVNGAAWMYLAAVLEKQNRSATAKKSAVVMPAGLIGGAETIVFYTLFILWPQQLVPLFIMMGTLVIATIGQRIVWALRHVEK